MANSDNVGPVNPAPPRKLLPKTAMKAFEYCRIYSRATFGSVGKPKIVFVWIPKTAGTSLFAALENELGMVNFCRSLSHVKLFRNRGATTFGHYDYRALLRAGYVSKEFDREAFKFCVVRDPYDRALSLYYYLKRIGRHSKSLVEFLYEVSKNRPPIGLYNSIGLSQANPQVDWITDESDAFIVDSIFRFEEMSALAEEFRRRFGIGTLEIGRLNQTDRDRSSADILYSHDEVVPLIEEIYAKDFLLLRYEKKGWKRSGGN